MDADVCRRARLSRDPRFDGRFFVAVKTTGIYCRPICPAPQPREANVRYFPTAMAAAHNGFRPCLRCRPDSAPDSWAWKGTDTTLERAVRLIDQGALIEGSVGDLSIRLGIGPRYLNKLFRNNLGTTPKQYALYQQLLFAKSLLQQTSLPVADVALAAGFGSVRRFNDCFARSLHMTPSQLRRGAGRRRGSDLRVFLSYRPPYAWTALQQFLQLRVIPGLEWCDEDHYGRTFRWFAPDGDEMSGSFTARHCEARCGFEVTIELDRAGPLLPIVRNIRRVLDLDAPIDIIDEQLGGIGPLAGRLQPGLRLPGIWSPFEAGVRAILGQQVSIMAARTLVSRLVNELGPVRGDNRLFPSPAELARADVSFLGMPGSRRETLTRFAQYYAGRNPAPEPEEWQSLKGIGPWTVSYARMRGMSESDIWLGGDLGVQRALREKNLVFDPAEASPWQSYLTFHLWSLT